MSRTDTAVRVPRASADDQKPDVQTYPLREAPHGGTSDPAQSHDWLDPGGYDLGSCEDSDMPAVPIGYPFQLDGGQLAKAIDDMLDKANWPGFDNFAGLQPDLKLALVANGLSERQRREQAAAAATALRLTYVTLAVSIIAVIISVITALTASRQR